MAINRLTASKLFVMLLVSVLMFTYIFFSRHATVVHPNLDDRNNWPSECGIEIISSHDLSGPNSAPDPSLRSGEPFAIFRVGCGSNISVRRGAVTVANKIYDRSYTGSNIVYSFESPAIPISDFDISTSPTTIAVSYTKTTFLRSETSNGVLGRQLTTNYYTPDMETDAVASFDSAKLRRVITSNQSIGITNRWMIFANFATIPLFVVGIQLFPEQRSSRGIKIVILLTFVVLFFPTIREAVAVAATINRMPAGFRSPIGSWWDVAGMGLLNMLFIIFVVGPITQVLKPKGRV